MSMTKHHSGIFIAVVAAVYFASNICITISNKVLMSEYGFNFPWILTSFQALVSGIGAHLVMYLEGTETGVTPKYFIAYSLLYTINNAVNNISITRVSLSFHQIIRSSSPIFTAVLEILINKKTYSLEVIFSFILIVIGITMTTIEGGL